MEKIAGYSPFVMATAPKKLTFICSWKSEKEVSFRLPFKQTPATRQHTPCETFNTTKTLQQHTAPLALMQCDLSRVLGASLEAHTLSISGDSLSHAAFCGRLGGKVLLASGATCTIDEDVYALTLVRDLRDKVVHCITLRDVCGNA